MDSQYKEKYSIELRKIDWDFTGKHKVEGFSSYHWYPARYVPQIAGILINYFSKPGDNVLDPFSGSGTTVVEAFKHGRRALGIDINPIAILISQAKLISFEKSDFNEFGNQLITKAKEISSDSEEDSIFRSQTLRIPNLEENEKWYHKDTLIELGALWNAINQLSNNRYEIVAKAAFSSILRYCCSQDKHWGWICDNVKPKEFKYKKAIDKFKKKIDEYSVNAEKLKEQSQTLQDSVIEYKDIELLQGNNLELLSCIKDEEFDLVVTSPPYYNMTDYVRAQRLSFLWFEFDENIDQLKSKEIGARFKRGRKKSKTDYVAEMKGAFLEVFRVIKPGAYMCVVIAESPKHESFLDEFEKTCTGIGFEICEVLTRSISKQRSLTPVIHKEKIYIMRKFKSYG